MAPIADVHGLEWLKAKMIPLDRLDTSIPDLPRPLVFTNGVFDVLHRGHVVYLAEARLLGNALLVALNTDVSARQLGKGPGRPVNNQQDRGLLIGALQCVDLVTWFDEVNPCTLIERFRPDVYVKGGDYQMETLEEARLVRSWGGIAVTIPFVAGYSTSSLLRRSQASVISSE
jgi:rfaE bifunctional protein nucleotidyltransferase chain/domain